jgi:hypothetical protein
MNVIGDLPWNVVDVPLSWESGMALGALTDRRHRGCADRAHVSRRLA